MLNKKEIRKVIEKSLEIKFSSVSNQMNFIEIINNLVDFAFDFYQKNNNININLAKGLHKLLYSKGTTINVYRDLQYYQNIPGEWRLHNYNPQIETTYYSKRKDIEKDFIKFTKNYSSVEKKSKKNILKYFFDFLRVHPFGDSNLTIASIICDLECLKNSYQPFNLLDIRYKNKDFIHYFIYYNEKFIEKENSLDEILKLIIEFNNGKISKDLVDFIHSEIEKLNIKTTEQLNNPKNKSDLIKKEALEKVLVLAKNAYKKGNYPIGAILIIDDEIKEFGENKVVIEKDKSLHAEIDLINKSGNFKYTKSKKILVVSMEPCNNCAKALINFGIDEVYYIVEDPSWGGTNILETSGVKVTQVKSIYYYEYLHLLIDFMGKHGGYNEVLNQYISISQNGENTYQKQLNKVIEDNFINISKDLENHEIRKIVYRNTIQYLKNALLRNSEDKHQLIFNGYIQDTNKIINFLSKNFNTNNNKNLDVNLIRELHKNLFPIGYIQKAKDLNGKEFISMIPGEYRKINLYSKTNQNHNLYFKWEDVEKGLENIVNKFNASNHEIKDILIFMSEFSIVHPFGDGNGRTIDILVDVICLKYGFEPFYFGELKIKNEVEFYKVLDNVFQSKKVEYFYDFIQKHK